MENSWDPSDLIIPDGDEIIPDEDEIVAGYDQTPEAPSGVRARPAAPRKKKRKKPKAHKVKPSQGRALWRTTLTRNGRGQINPTLGNTVTILRNDPNWEGVLAYNCFSDTVFTRRKPRWHRRDRPATTLRKAGPWTDQDDVLLTAWFEREYDLVLKDGPVRGAVSVVSRISAVHPIRDFLNGLEWDGVPRANRWLIDFGGAKNTPYVRAVSGMWLLSAVARAFRPGCQVDHVLILEGDQGIGKSSLLRAIVPDPDWFLVDVGSEFGEVDSYQKLKGKWIVEMSELDSLNKSELTAAKSFLTCPVDTYRKSYGRTMQDYPRHTVFAGTTNKDTYLQDETGNRRFWPVRLKKIDLVSARLYREQIWAEAVARFRAGEGWHIADPELLAAAKAEQAQRVQQHPWLTKNCAVPARRKTRRARNISVSDFGRLPSNQGRSDHKKRRDGRCMHTAILELVDRQKAPISRQRNPNA